MALPSPGPSQNQRRLIDAAFEQVLPLKSTARSGGAIPKAARRALAVVATADWIPGYRIVREIHRGGQGVVFESVQESTRRRVAIKVLHAGPFAGPQERLRFEREVQILAQLRHPNIVTIHDSGVSGDAAYFVMDYIDGEPLDRHVERAGLTPRQVAALFVRICDAVNAAHLRGVIHRDLKPGNIRIDTQGEPHILDFGLAKEADATPQDNSSNAMTMTGQFVGSMPWASPEQAEGRSDTVDVRTDVYALGVMLYQLLTGQFPYKVNGTVRETVENICRATPPNPRQINAALDDELSTIVLMALRKSRDERYQSAGELGRDLARFLAGEPIAAKRESLGYLVRKQLARHRTAASVALGFAVTIGVAAVVLFALYREATAARDAEREQRVIAQKNAERAVDEARKATAVTEFLRDVLQAADPVGRGGPKLSVRDALDAAGDRLDRGALRTDPAVEAAVRTTLGLTLMGVGEVEPAERHLTAALELTRATLGDDHRDTAKALADMGTLAMARGRYVEAEQLFREALTRYESLGEAGTVAVLDVLNGVGLALWRQGKLELAEPFYQRALEGARRLSPPSITLAATLNNYGLLMSDSDRFDEADRMLRESHGLYREIHGDRHIRVVSVLESIAAIPVAREQVDAAVPIYREALALRREILGDDHPDVALALNNLGWLMFSQEQYDEAEALYEESIAIRRRTQSPDHPSLATVLNNLGLLCARQKRHDEAEALYGEALRIKLSSLGPTHPSTLLQIGNMVSLLRDAGRHIEAEAMAADLVARAATVYEADHPSFAILRGEWGASLLAVGCLEDAERELLACYEGVQRRFGPDAPRTRGVARRLVDLYRQRGDTAAVEAWQARASPGA